MRSIGYRPVATASAAGGVWTLREQAQWKKEGLWPRPDPYSANTVLLLPMTGNNGSTTFTDYSPSARAVAVNASVAVSTTQSKWGTGSAYFNGSSSVLSYADSADWDFGTGDFTVEVWTNFSSLGASYNIFLSTHSGGALGWSVQRRTDYNSLGFTRGDTNLANFTWTPTLGTWYHLAICRSGTNLRWFVDGTQLGTTVTDSSDFSGSTRGLELGALYYYAYASYIGFYHGYLQDLRVTKGIARYTTTFTPPGSLA